MSGLESVAEEQLDSAALVLKDKRQFVWAIGIALFIILLLPMIYGVLMAPAGSQFLGFPLNLDDHMVYAAWMRQAMDGHFFFDNRFTVDSQPALTIHVYFFALGLLAKLVGIPIASNAARVGFSIAFLYLLVKLIRRLGRDAYFEKLAISLGLLAGGIGFLVWHDFGVDLVRPSTLWMKPLTQGKLPNDVWQPEGFVFSSLFTNGLFAVSLCLIVTIFLCVLKARERSPKALVIGFFSMAILMNIHSYDVLLIGLVLAGFLVSSLAVKQVSAAWVGRVVVICAGAIAPALWFIHVLAVDEVFKARAATPTYAPNFQSIVLGYLPMLVFGIIALARHADPASKPKRQVGLLLLLVAMLVAWFASSSAAGDGYMLSTPIFAATMLLALGAVFCLATEEPTFNLLMAWAIIGLFAMYFPGLFQRKLAMGLSLPWSLLAAIGIADLLRGVQRGKRNLFTVVTILVFVGTSVRWILRDFRLISLDVARTTVQPVSIQSDFRKALAYLNALPAGRIVVVAVPGSPNPLRDESGQRVEDSYVTPIIPDYNPLLSGLAGVYTYAGHWSETPDYLAKRDRSIRDLFLATSSSESRRAFLADSGADYIYTPVQQAIPGVADLSSIGDVVVQGNAFELIKVRK